MAEDKGEGEGPLSSEALKRDEWRDGATRLCPEDAPGHSLPESEGDRASEGGDRQPSGGISGTILPPD
jgi:hypothetical protein